MQNNDFYVYEHIRLDNETCFYVGKGRKKRAYISARNPIHDEIVKKHGMKVNIIKDNLSEEEAYDLERKTILHYVFDLGYGIDIIGQKDINSTEFFLTNKAFGGKGSYGAVHTEAWKEQHSLAMSGSNNPMYGINVWDTYDEERSKRIKDKISKSSSGINNPMYEVSPMERMTEDVYAQWLEKLQNRLHSQTGFNNPNYGNKTLHNKVKDNPQLRIEYYSRPGAQNGRSRPISVYDKDGNFISKFAYIGDCAEWIKDKYGISSKINSMRGGISDAAKTGKLYRGLLFSFDD